MPDARADGAARLVLYVSLGAFALLCLAILGFELYAPWLVRMAYEQALIPPLNRLISDRSYPLSHFQRYAPFVFYKGLTLPVLLTLGAVLASWGYLHRNALAQGLAPLRAYTARLPGAYQWTIAALLGGLLAAQVVDTNRATFPLTSWKVYGSAWEPPEIVYHEFWGRTAHGDTVRLNPERLFRAAEGIIYHRLEHRGEALRGRLRATRTPVYDQALRSIGKQYERRHDSTLLTVFVRRISTDPVHVDSSWRDVEVLRQIKVDPPSPNPLSSK
jgi:hypothetical protein